ncbi:hypothetical protein HYZ97_03780 [Candidatus Pacearchaeota archaeon]|nr:hypothetical protein [Candidatus Pacearchaeota archaeon]
MVDAKDILKKYRTRIESQFESTSQISRDYLQFKQDMLHENSVYERWALALGNLVHLKIADKDRIKMEQELSDAHISVTPSQALTLSLFSFILVFLLTLLIGTAYFLITSLFPILFIALGFLASIFVFYYTYTMPRRLANAWKLKASAQMIPAVLYVVVYMKHTSNLERAIEFASQHLEGPLALDLKKIFYDVEVGKYTTIKQSLDRYLEKWRMYAPEFVESFHLIESSLYEPSESRRVDILEKSLQVILDGVYEKMLKYSRDIRSPLTNVYMLGIILPTLAIALLPLASTLLGGILRWYHVMVIFNILIPLLVFYLTSEILLKRPGGYGESSVLELNPDYKTFIARKPWIIAAAIALPLVLIGLLPFLFQVTWFTSTFNLQSDYTYGQLGLSFLEETKIFDFKQTPAGKTGPFGLVGVLLSLFIPLGAGLFFGIAYHQKTKTLIESRERTKRLEEEFTNSLFQLGNRLGDNIPAEIAFARVAESTQGQMTHSFFALVNQNIQELGMSVDRAVFDKKRGAIIYYPSPLIATSMRILLESVKKGLQVAARSLMSISEYVKNIQKINQRLRDLLAEIVSDMKSNMTFLAPLLSGIVVGLAVMIATILNKLQAFQETLGGETGAAGLANISSITNIFDITTMIPPYFIQAIIGIYIIEIIFILTSALVTVDSGKDTLKEKYELSRNLRTGLMLYLLTALVALLALAILASVVLSQF